MKIWADGTQGKQTSLGVWRLHLTPFPGVGKTQETVKSIAHLLCSGISFLPNAVVFKLLFRMQGGLKLTLHTSAKKMGPGGDKGICPIYCLFDENILLLKKKKKLGNNFNLRHGLGALVSLPSRLQGWNNVGIFVAWLGNSNQKSCRTVCPWLKNVADVKSKGTFACMQRCPGCSEKQPLSPDTLRADWIQGRWLFFSW